jgi:hypothetical protein
VGEDITFWNDCRDAGFELWADLDLTYEIGHIGESVAQCPDLRKQKGKK